jgi:protein SCO1/2
MSQNKDKSATTAAKPVTWWRRHRLPLFAGVIFLGLAAVVFMIAENQAQKKIVGFPDFAESPFSLTDQRGALRTNADFSGQPIALFFGFTYCPDICPTTLISLANAMDELRDDGVDTTNLQVIFISVDAARDTPQQLREYLTLFDMDVVGLTGDAGALAGARQSFGAFAQKITTDDGDVSWDHSAAVYLYRANGKFAGTIVFNEAAAFITEKLRNLLS